MDLDVPKVMGILNITPDSFYSESRTKVKDEIFLRVSRMIEEGVDIIDIGGCSTRPGFTPPSEKEEIDRINLGCKIVKEVSTKIPISIDTFRASVAENAIKNWNVNIINDISGGEDPKMFEVVAKNKIIYVLTYNNRNSRSNILADALTFLSDKISKLHILGVNDIIIDPGFGFGKFFEENYQLFNGLNEISKIGCPVLVGISRKSMIYKELNCGPEDALPGTIALNALALDKGANILRVHDVKDARDVLKIYMKLKATEKSL